MPPSTIIHLGHIVPVLRRSPASVTSSTSSSCRRADETLPQHSAGSEFEGRHRAELVQELGGTVRSVLDQSYHEDVGLHQPRCANASAFGLRGYVDTLSPLVAMHLLDRSCVCIVIFLKLLHSPTVVSEPGLCVDVICTSRTQRVVGDNRHTAYQHVIL